MIQSNKVFIYERRDIQFFYYDVKKSWKLKRGWLYIFEAFQGHFTLCWTFRKYQHECEHIKTFATLESAIDFVDESTFVLKGKRTRGHIRDSQREKVYNWERKCLDIFETKTLSHHEMTDFLKLLASQNNLKLRKVKYRSGGACSFARGVGELQFLPIHMTKVTACHEVAHLMINQIYTNKEVAGHGPEWVRVYVDLLIKHCGFKELDLITSLKQHKIKIGN